MSKAVHQINLSFNPAEDRMLLRITASVESGLAEYRLWLTRRFVKLLWKVLDRMLEEAAVSDPALGPEGREAIKRFQQADILSRADFKTPFQGGDAAASPLGPDPLLITRFRVMKGPSGSQILNLMNEEGKGVHVTMNVRLIHSVRKLLSDKVREAQWDLSCDLLSEETPYLAEAPKSLN